MAKKTIEIEIPITTVDNTDPGLSQIKNKIKGMGSEAQSASSKMNSATNRAKRGFDSAASSAQRGFDKSTKSAKGFDKELNNASRDAREFAKEKIEKIIQVKDQATPILEKVGSTGKAIAGKVWKVTLKGVDAVTAPFKKIVNAITSPLGTLGITVGGTAMLSDVEKTYSDFEAEMSKVQAISGASGEQFDALTAKAKKMGETTKFTATESGQAMEYMAMAGWKADDMLNGISGIMSLASASGEDLATTSDIVTDALTAFGLKASDSTHFADVLAKASASSNTNVAKMGETFKYVGAIAGTMGYSIEDTGIAIGLMANSGIKASQAGTALRSIITRLASPTKTVQEAIDKLHVSITNSDGSAKSLKDVMDQLRGSMSGLSKAEQTTYAKAIAGQYGMSGLLSIVNASKESYDELTDEIYNADGASEQMSNTMLNNQQGKWTLFKSALDSVKISLGERFEPYVLDAIQWATDHLPDLNEALQSGMDWVDRFVDNSEKKMKKLKESKEWKNADFFGRVKLSFDTIIGQPFSEWWETKGKRNITEKLYDVGKGLGSAVSVGLMTLLGIDVGDTIDEGESVGASFAKGFAEGFNSQDVRSALGKAIQNVFGDSMQLFSGSGGLSSLLSTILLVKGAGLIGKGISGISKFAKGAKKVMGSFNVDDAIWANLTEEGGMQGKGILGALGTAGYKMTGATTTAGSIAAGAAGIGGGIVGGLVATSGAVDIANSTKAKNENDQKGLFGSGVSKLGGVGAGAAIGTIIAPGIGTLIGAGVGGIAGAIGGSVVQGHYKKQQNYIDKSTYAMKNAKFASKELQEAFEDSSVSADDFGRMMDKAINKTLKSSFGTIELTSQELKDATSNILFNGDTKNLEKFTSATNDLADAQSDLTDAQNEYQKMQWKVNQGMIESTQDRQDYVDSVKSLETATKKYLDDQRYAANSAVNLISPGSTDITSGINSMYEGFGNEYDSLKEQLDNLLSDGEIDSGKVVRVKIDGVKYDLNEDEAVAELAKKMQEITDKLTETQFSSQLDLLGVKNSGAALSSDSYEKLIEEVKQEAQDAIDQYDEAYTLSLSNVKLELQNGSIDKDEYDKQVSELLSGYNAKVSKIGVNIEGFEFQSIEDAFGKDLDGLLPNLTGDVSERLQKAFNNALSAGVDVGGQTLTGTAKMLGLDDLHLTQEEQDTISQEVQDIYNSLPKAFISAANKHTNGDESTIQGSDISSVFSDYISSGLKSAEGDGKITSSIDSLYSKVDSDIDNKFSSGVNTKTSVTITPQYTLAAGNESIVDQFLNNNPIHGKLGISSHANGGAITGPELSTLGEDGKEYVIPVSGEHRSRGYELWRQAGQDLGVSSHADGGTVGTEIGAAPSRSGPVNVNVEVNPTFKINEGSSKGGNIVSQIESHISEIANLLGAEVANQLKTVFANMPS